MEKPPDSGSGENWKREGGKSSGGGAPWPRGKCSSDNLEVMERRFFLQSEGDFAGGVPRGRIF